MSDFPHALRFQGSQTPNGQQGRESKNIPPEVSGSKVVRGDLANRGTKEASNTSDR